MEELAAILLTTDEEEAIGKHPDYPDALIRLASSVHRFHCPTILPILSDNSESTARISKQKLLSFQRAFTTVGQEPKTWSNLEKGDEARRNLHLALSALANCNGKKRNYMDIVEKSRTYQTYIRQILLSCAVQPEDSILDEKLNFEWSSALYGKNTQKKKRDKIFKSQALMYDSVMTLMSECFALAGLGCDHCVAGEFPQSANCFKAAAGIMNFMVADQLPHWKAKNSSGVLDEKNLPPEVSAGLCEALEYLFLATAQQMAIATLLIRNETPNFSALAKLSLGVCSLYGDFERILRNKASIQMALIDENIMNLVAFQISLQKGLSLYFSARKAWNDGHYGLGIAFLAEARLILRSRPDMTSPGLPNIDPNSSLHVLTKDSTKLRSHIATLIELWEKDNSSVYFDKVPPRLPEEHRLKTGVIMMKVQAFKYMEENVEPLRLVNPARLPSQKISSSPSPPKISEVQPIPPPPLSSIHDDPPPYPGTLRSLERSDSDLARELQTKLDADDKCA